MKIFVDADACPVKAIIERVAKAYSVPVVMIIDVNHILSSDYSEIITVSQGADSVDLYLINRVSRGDIVISQDYGVASLALGKGAFAIGNSGLIYSDDNIDRLMFERYLGKKQRNCSARMRGGHIAKRTKADDEAFEKSLIQIIKK